MPLKIEIFEKLKIYFGYDKMDNWLLQDKTKNKKNLYNNQYQYIWYEFDKNKNNQWLISEKWMKKKIKNYSHHMKQKKIPTEDLTLIHLKKK